MKSKFTHKPDFLVVGSAKAGTTSLFNFLGEHPQVFLPKRKEPKFFSYSSGINKLNGPRDEKTIQFAVKTPENYQALYKNKGSKIAGDGSVDNLYFYSKVIPLIKEYLGDVKIIICLRDPIARAFSAYSMQLRDSRETLSYSDALKEEANRIKDNYEFIWHYKNCGLYYEQVKAYMDNFTNVKIVFNSDLRHDTQNTMDSVLSFLNINEFNFDLEKNHNVTGIPKNKLFHQIFVLSSFGRTFRKLFLSEKLKNFLKEKVFNKLIKYEKVEKETHENSTLLEFFKDDVDKLSKLLDKDLYQLWLKKYETNNRRI